MYILIEQAVYGHHNGVILPFGAWKKKEKWTQKLGANFVKIEEPNGLASFAGGLVSSTGGLASSAEKNVFFCTIETWPIICFTNTWYQY